MSLTSYSRHGKIHVAPCSCELHVRIRELEAELTRRVGDWSAALAAHDRAVARAEKAEARVAELEHDYRDHATVFDRERMRIPYAIGDETPSQRVQEREAD